MADDWIRQPFPFPISFFLAACFIAHVALPPKKNKTGRGKGGRNLEKVQDWYIMSANLCKHTCFSSSFKDTYFGFSNPKNYCNVYFLVKPVPALARVGRELMEGEGERGGTIGHNRNSADCRPRSSSSFSFSIPFYAGHIAPAESRKGGLPVLRSGFHSFTVQAQQRTEAFSM